MPKVYVCMTNDRHLYSVCATLDIAKESWRIAYCRKGEVVFQEEKFVEGTSIAGLVTTIEPSYTYAGDTVYVQHAGQVTMRFPIDVWVTLWM